MLDHQSSSTFPVPTSSVAAEPAVKLETVNATTTSTAARTTLNTRQKTPFTKDFILLAVTQLTSLFGNQVLRYALPLYLLIETGSAALFGSIMAASFIPMLVVFPIGGIIADRVNKRNIMIVLDSCTALLILAFNVLSGVFDVVPLIAATMILLFGIYGAYQPAVMSSVPVLIDSEHILQANSIIDLISSSAGIAGPVLGGVLFSVFGLKPILYASIACFALSALVEVFMQIPHQKSQTQGNALLLGLTDLKESFAFLFLKQPILWKVALVYSSTNLLLSSLVMIAVPVVITQHLGFEPDLANRLYGYAQGVIASGAVLGGLLVGILSKRLKPQASPFILAASAFSILIAGFALHLLSNSYASFALMIIGCGLMLVMSTLFQIQMLTYIQVLTPVHLTGKVISSVMCLCMCASPLGQLIYGLVFDSIGYRVFIPFYIAFGVMLIIIFLTRQVFKQLTQLVQD